MKFLRGRNPYGRLSVAVILMGFFLVSVSGAAAAFKNIKVGDAALAISLKDLEGNVHTLAEPESGKAVLLFFWATWSQRSLLELEDLKKLNDQYGPKGLTVLAVNVENQNIDPEDLAQIRSVLADKGIDYTVVIDEGLETYNEWGVIATPTTAIVDQSGTVVYDLSSYPTSGYMDLEEGVQKALGLYVEPAEEVAAQAGYQPNREALLRFGLGKRLLDKGFVTKAIPELVQSAVADSHFTDPVIYLAYAHLREGNGEAASQQLEKALALEPERPETLLLKAHMLLGERKLDEAADIVQTVAPAADAGAEPAESVDAAPAAAETATESAPGAAPAAPAAAGSEKPAAGGLTEALALKEQGKTDEAIKALDGYVSARLLEKGIRLERKHKLSAMEKMKLMMQKKGTSQ